ncbi:MAG: flagellar protein FlgN [Sedimenticola sp.]|nr:flagellar protein FlgN [Sedimenticola sp.]MCW8920145.1 flagellar protein FlgN [Sedimenticola sp.]MCW8974547.1 flagellar protein FlgN [Sedimenticola sp.]
MKLSAELQNQFEQLLAAEHACAKTLLDTIQRENSALRANDIEQIESLSNEKKLGMRHMWECMQQRDRWLIGHNLETGSPGTIALMQANPDSRSAELWRRLSQTAIKLHEQNEVNGGIVAMSQRHNKQALDILCGRTGITGSTYGSKGEHSKEHSGHCLAKA